MPITTIDPHVALIVVDLQVGLADMPTSRPFDDVVASAVKLIDAFRAKQLPVILVNVAGGAPGRTEQSQGERRLPTNWTELVPQLKQQPTDKTVTKYTWGAFHDTDLDRYLDKLSVTQVVIVGVSTSIGVETTARQAYERGFNVTLATDAMSDVHPMAHDNTVAHIFPRLGETGTTDDILAILPGRG